MPAYFHSRGRKLGVVALVMALMLTGGWIRGLAKEVWIIDKLIADDAQYVQYRLGLTLEGFRYEKYQGHTAANGKPVELEPVLIIIPLGPLAVAMALISAYLLLWRPSKSTQPAGGRIVGAFFRGWRRKVGCVTLLMACLFVADFTWQFNRPNTSNEIPETAMMLDVAEILFLLPISAYLIFSKPEPKPPASV